MHATANLLCVLIDIYSNFIIDFLLKSIIINILDIVWFILGFKYLKKYIYQCVSSSVHYNARNIKDIICLCVITRAAY